jgi:type II secretion system protein N
MSPRLRRILLWVLYPVFYLVCFALFGYLTFPFDSLRDRVVVAFAEDQRKSGGDSQLEIDRLSSYWFSGAEAHGVRIISAPSVKPDGTKGPPSEFAVDRVAARVALLPLLIGRVTIHFSADLLGGTLSGSTRKSGDDRSLSLELSDLSVGEIGPLVEVIGLPLTGRLGGTVDLTLPEGKMAKATGSIELTLQDLSVGDGKSKIKDTIALPRMVVGDLELACDIAEGRVTITKLAAAGNDLDFNADGKITLREKLAESQADLYLRFRFSDKYKSKDEKTKALFGAPGSNAPALFEIADPRIRQSKRPDGFYSWRAWGLLRTLRFDPAPAGGAGPSRGQPAAPGGVRGFTR